MNILLAGVSCVGKTTIGKRLAEKLGYKFFDLDRQIEKFYQKPIERLKEELITEYSFRIRGAYVLQTILLNRNNQPCVVALPPSGLRDRYYHVIRKTKCMTIVLDDAPEHILSRSIFYDKDSNLLHVRLTASQKIRYVRGIKEDIDYFHTYYKRADRRVDISGLTIEACVQKIGMIIKQPQTKQ